MSQPPDASTATARPREEVDVWWGSCAGRTLTPSFIVCGLLTAAWYVAARELVPERYLQQLAFSTLASLLWVVQLLRWGHRFFTWNYRLTTRYLYIDRGFRPLVARRHALTTIRAVKVVRSRWQKLLGIGDVCVYFQDAGQAPAVLAALVHPDAAADVLRQAVEKYGQEPSVKKVYV
jgi:hypothetical protein